MKSHFWRYEEYSVEEFDWPAQNQDMNLIEQA